MTESRAVWKDLGSRRIRKSLEMELGLGDNVKRQGFLMVYTCTMEMKMYDIGQWKYDVKAHIESMVALRKTHMDE